MIMKTKILFTILIISTTLCSAQITNNRLMKCKDIAKKMQIFFSNTLQENYGFLPDSVLYSMFFESFYESAGGYVLSINRKKMKEINGELFTDSIYYYFFPKIVYVSTSDSVSILVKIYAEKGDSNICVVCRRDQWGKSIGDNAFNARYNLTGFVEKNIFENNSNSEVLRQIEAMRKYKGYDQNMFDLIDAINQKPAEIQIPEVKNYVAVVFWKYLCYCSNWDLINRTKKGKYDLY